MSVLLLFMPIDTCMEPWVVSLTPPGPNTFSSGPSEKFMSKMLKGSLSFFSYVSRLRSLKYPKRSLRIIMLLYSSAVIM